MRPHVVVKDSLTPVAAGHDVIKSARILDPNCSCRGSNSTANNLNLSRFVD